MIVSIALSAPASASAPGQLFSPTSAFNTPIGRHPSLEPQSARYLPLLVAAAKQKGFVLSPRRWTVPVYWATAQTAKTTVRLTASWRAADALNGVPIPRGARPDPEDDAHLSIIDVSAGCEYDFWQAQLKDGSWRASWGNALPLASSGTFPGGASARGSGFALSAGLIFPQELRNGTIGHALIFAYPTTRAGLISAPATQTDGWSYDRYALPEGAHLQLDPALDLSRLHLSRWQHTVAVALQRYGMYLADTGGAVGISAAGSYAYPSDPYVGVLPADTYPSLPLTLLSHMRVLKFQPVTRQSSLDTRGCGSFSGLH